MPKETQREFNMRMLLEFPKIFRADNNVLFCTICDCKAPATKLSSVKNHLDTGKHKKAAAIKTKCSTSQTLVSSFQRPQPEINEFHMNLCKAFLEANIPLHKFSNPSIVNLFEKYMNRPVPSENTLRNKYVPILYEQSIADMRAKAANKCIWVALDETTDSEQRFIANFVFGLMESVEEDSTERGKCYLLNMGILKSANANCVSAFFVDSLSMLYPEGIKYDKVLLATTDAASYMLSAMRSMQTLFPKMLHVTCFAHGLHRLADFIRLQFPIVNDLIAKVKAVFVKAPSRRLKFKMECPDLPMPPEPIFTRFGTWLEAAIYYCDNFDAVRSVVDSFDSEEAVSIEKAQELFASREIKSQLAYIKSNFTVIVRAITKLQTQGLELNESVEINEMIFLKMNSLTRKEFANKLKAVHVRNVGYDTIREIRDVLYEGKNSDNEYVQKLSPAEIGMFKYSPTTSIDVERSFSDFKVVFSERRKSFLFENLKKHVIVKCNRLLVLEEERLM